VAEGQGAMTHSSSMATIAALVSGGAFGVPREVQRGPGVIAACRQMAPRVGDRLAAKTPKMQPGMRRDGATRVAKAAETPERQEMHVGERA